LLHLLIMMCTITSETKTNRAIKLMCRRLILTLSTISLLLFSCNKDGYEFPYATINTYLYPSNAEYGGLHFPGGTAYINGGVNGILIFQDYFNTYIAYDRACTNDPLNGCEQVYIDSELTNTLSCSCCDSQFLIYDGSVIRGPASHALHRYQTTFDGIRLSIYN
jgi:Rieske Fe-S protein